jgi:hypothetical protein
MSQQQPSGEFRPDYGPGYQQQPATASQYIAPSPQFTQGAPGYGQGPYPPAQAPVPPRAQPPRRARRIPLPVLVGCTIALVLAAGAYLISGGGNVSPTASGGSGMTAYGKLTTLWAAGGTAGSGIHDFSGSWATSDVVVDARIDGAIAYELGNHGTQKWGWQAPAGDSTCEMTTGTSEGIGVIAYGDTADGANSQGCDHLVGLDVETGAVLWTITLDPNQSTDYSVIKVNDPYISISGDTLAAQGEDQTVDVFNLRTGKLRWQTPNTVGSIEANVCDPEGIQVVAQHVYELASCLSTSAGGGQSNLINVYPANAASAPKPTLLQGTASLPTGTTPELWQAGNYLLAVGFSETRASEILAYDAADGASTPATIALGSYSQDAFESSMDGQLNPRAWAVNGDTLYIEDQGASSTVNGVAAVSLKTGKQLWDQTPGGDTASSIVQATSSGVEVVMSVPQQSGYKLAALAASNGAASNGPGTSDNRFFIDGSNSSLYIEGTFLINIEDMAVGGTPGIVVLSGATG